MEDFTGSAIQDQPARRSSNIGPEFEKRVRDQSGVVANSMIALPEDGEEADAAE